MEQLQIKYRDEITKKLDPLYIYNDTLTYMKVKILKNNFANLILIITLFVIAKQPKKKSEIEINNSFNKILLVICIVLFIYGYSEKISQNENISFLQDKLKENTFYGNIKGSIDNTFDGVNNTIKDFENDNISDLVYYKYNTSNDVVEDESVDILNFLTNILKWLFVIFMILFIINMMILSSKAGNDPELPYLILYIIIFSIIFYYLIKYLFQNFIDKQENNFRNKLSLLQILAYQTYVDDVKYKNTNDIDTKYFADYRFLLGDGNNYDEYADHNYPQEKINNFVMDSRYYNLILNIFSRKTDDAGKNISKEEKIKKLRNDITYCFTAQEKKSIINTEKDIIEPLNDSKNTLSLDNNKYEIEVQFTSELTNFFHLLFQTFKGYQDNYYKGDKITDNYTKIETGTTIIYPVSPDPKIDIEISGIQTYKLTHLQSPEHIITFISNEIIESQNDSYKIYNIYNNLNRFQNLLNTISAGFELVPDSPDKPSTITKNNLIKETQNPELYEIIEYIFGSEGYTNITDFIYKLRRYIGIDGLNYTNICSLLKKYFNESVWDTETSKISEVSKPDYKKKIFNFIHTSLEAELIYLKQKLNILDKIYDDNKNALLAAINSKDAESYYREYIVKNKDEIQYDISQIKKEYFKDKVKKEIDLFNNTIKTVSVSDDDLKLFKNNEYGNYKYSLYIYKYFIKEFVNIFFDKTNNKVALDDILAISNEKIYKVFLNELNKHKSNVKVDEEKLLKNYKKIFKFLISKYQLEDIKQCMLTIEIDPNLKGLSKFVSKDIFNKIILEKDKKFFYNECCKYDKLQEHFQIKYKPLIDYEIKNKIIDKNLVLNIINIFLYLILTIVGLYLFQGFIMGIFSDSNIKVIRDNIIELPLKLAEKLKLRNVISNIGSELVNYITKAPLYIIYAIINIGNALYYNSMFDKFKYNKYGLTKWFSIFIYICLSIYMLLYTIWILSYFILVFFDIKGEKTKWGIQCLGHGVQESVTGIDGETITFDTHPLGGCKDVSGIPIDENKTFYETGDGYKNFILKEITKKEYWITYLIIYSFIYVYYRKNQNNISFNSIRTTIDKTRSNISRSITSIASNAKNAGIPS